MANPFNKFWSGLDFWDKEENKRQRQQAAQQEQPKPQPQQEPQIKVAAPQQQPNVVVQTPQPQPQVQVKNIDPNRQDITLPDGRKMSEVRKTPQGRVDAGLDAGKSWEDIAKENNLTPESVKEYSQRTRPNYGIAKPKQSLWNKISDTWDADTEMDRYKRREQGQEVDYTDPKFWQRTRDFAVGAGREFARVPETVFQSIDRGMDETAANDIDAALAEKDPAKRRELVNKITDPRGGWFQFGKTKTLNPDMNEQELTALRDELRASQEGAPQYNEGLKRFFYGSEPVQTYQQRGRGLREELKNDETAAQKLLEGRGEGGKEAAEFATRNAGVIAPLLVALGIGMDVAPDPSDLIKGGVKKGGKEVAEEFVESSADEVLSAVGKAASKEGEKALDDILEEVAQDSPELLVQISDDLKNAPNVDLEEIRKSPTKDLDIGVDSTPEPDLDTARVQEYVDRIKRGEPIDPLVVSFDDAGKAFVQDGAHRLAALKQLGIENAPIVQLKRVGDTTQVVDGKIINTTTGEILGDAPKSAAEQGVETAARQVEEAQQPIVKQQEQAAQQATSGNIAEGADDYMQQLQARREEWTNADEATRAEMVARAQADTADELSLEVNPWSRQAVYEDLLSTGMTPEDIVKLTQRYGMNAQEWRAVLNATGDLSKARDVAAVLDSQIKKVTGKTGKPAAREAAEQVAEEAPAAATPNPMTSTYQNNIDAIKQSAQENLELIDSKLKENGSSFEQLARKVQAADRSGTPPDFTPIEARAYSLIREELDKTLGEAIQAGRASADTQMREFYLPQAREGATAIPETMEDLYNTGFGYDIARTNAIDLEDLDYGFNPLIDYVVKGKASEQLVKQRIYDDIVETYPNITREGAEAAVETRTKMIDDINRQTEDPKAKPDGIDTAGALKKEAEELGIQRVQDNSRIDRLSINAEDKLKSIGQYNGGFHQYRDATALAQNVTDTAELPEFFREIGLDKISDKRIGEIVARTDYLLENSGRFMADATPEQLENYSKSVVSNAIRSAAKGNVEELLRVTDFTDPNTLKFLNSEFNQMAIGFNKAESTINKLGMIARRVMNNSMRNLNVNSFLNEMTDVVNVLNRFGMKGVPALSPRGMYDIVDRYGFGHTINAMDNLDYAVEAFSILGSGNKQAIDKLFKAADTIDRKTALYSIAENYKAGAYLKAAEDWYTANTPLRGVDLTNKVLEDFHRDMLPLDHFSRVFATDNQAIKLLTQYMDWNILNTRQQFRNLIGNEAGGKYMGMSRGGRISRNLATNLAPRIGLGMVRGVPIVTTLGILDPAGVLSPDYTGIQDKTGLDRILQFAGISPITSLATQAYFNYRQDEEIEKQYEGNPPEDLRGDAGTRTLHNIANMFTPFGGQIKRTNGMIDVLGQGYSENKNGRVQYLAPDNPLDILRGLVMGKGQTSEGREYSGTPDIFSVLSGDATLPELFTSNPSVEAITNEGDYQRPLSDRDYIVGKDANGEPIELNYSDMVKMFVEEGNLNRANELLQGGRAFNQIGDDFRENNPEAYALYEDTFNGNYVKPEFWRQITGGNADGGVDLATFKMMGERKKQLAKDLKAPYDPIYDLPDDQARSILQYKSAATGDDIALQNILYKSQWYKDYVAQRDAYYDNMPEGSQDETGNTERVKQWNNYEKQLIALKTMEDPALQARFPYTSAYKAAQAEFEKTHPNQEFFGSEESKAWYGVYGEGYKAEKEAVDAAELEVINLMRGIEGHPPMSMEQYKQATNIADTSGGSGGSGGGNYAFLPHFSNSYEAKQFAKVKNKAPKFTPDTQVSRKKNPQAKLGASSRGT